MKKVIRLTESDLVRIVKRVISEQDPFKKKDDPFKKKEDIFKKDTNFKQLPKKLKVLDLKGQLKGNWDIQDIQFDNNELKLDYTTAGNSQKNKAVFDCGKKKLKTAISIFDKMINSPFTLTFSKEGIDWIDSNYCKKYVENNKNNITSSYT